MNRSTRWTQTFVLLLVCGWAIPILCAETIEPRSVERIVWEKTPIPITLPVGTERLVSFPGAVRVGIPAEIQPMLRTQSADGTIYWLAGEPFDVQRVQVQDIATGEIVLTDLKAVEKNPSVRSSPIEITFAATEAAQSIPAGDGNSAELDYVTLTRFAAQQLYAPQRLLTTPQGVYRAPAPRGSVQLARGLPVEAVPVAAWRGGNLHVTAVRLRNLGSDPVILDPRTLRGTWLAACFQHARLHPAGSEADTTAVYLISARPFEESL